MKNTKLAYILFILLFSCSDAVPDGTLGGDRPANVFLPSDYDDNKSYPLITLLHGFGATGETQNAYFGIGDRIDESQFVLIVPEGNKNALGQQYWNATDACCDFEGKNPNDKVYLMSLVDEAIEKYNIDERSVSFIGHSNGGFMSHTMACEYGDRISAIVSLAGTTYLDATKCKDTGDVNVLQVHGTFDLTIDYKGADQNLTLNGYLGAEDTVKRWAKRNGCVVGGRPGEDLNISTAVPDKETKTRFWLGCDNQTKVELWTIEGGSHLPALSSVFEEGALEFLTSTRSK